MFAGTRICLEQAWPQLEAREGGPVRGHTPATVSKVACRCLCVWTDMWCWRRSCSSRSGPGMWDGAQRRVSVPAGALLCAILSCAPPCPLVAHGPARPRDVGDDGKGLPLAGV